MEIFLICCAVISLAGIILLVKMNKKDKETNRYRIAAEKIYKDAQLTQLMRNPYAPHKDENKIGRNFICIKELNGVKKHDYVFPLWEPVTVGRSGRNNKLVISSEEISEYQCMIYESGEDVILRDLNSANGQMIKSGFQKKWVVQGNAELLENNDLLFIGREKFKIRFLYL